MRAAEAFLAFMQLSALLILDVCARTSADIRAIALLKAMIGGGILALPYAFGKVRLGLAAALMPVVAALTARRCFQGVAQPGGARHAHIIQSAF